MAKTAKARVFMSGRSQHVTIPKEFRFTSNEVSVRRGSKPGEIVLTQTPQADPPDWNAIFKKLDEAGFPKDFLADRKQGPPQKRKLFG